MVRSGFGAATSLSEHIDVQDQNFRPYDEQRNYRQDRHDDTLRRVQGCHSLQEYQQFAFRAKLSGNIDDENRHHLQYADNDILNAILRQSMPQASREVKAEGPLRSPHASKMKIELITEMHLTQRAKSPSI